MELGVGEESISISEVLVVLTVQIVGDCHVR